MKIAVPPELISPTFFGNLDEKIHFPYVCAAVFDKNLENLLEIEESEK